MLVVPQHKVRVSAPDNVPSLHYPLHCLRNTVSQMHQETTDSDASEPPSLPAALTQFSRAHSAPNLKISTTLDPHQVPLNFHIPTSTTKLYPTLVLHPYNLRRESIPTNVLAFLHNATKGEIVDLVSVVIPAIETRPSAIILENPPFGSALREWWRILLRFLFFVAETNDEIIKLMVAPVFRYLKRVGDIKMLNNLQKQRRSIVDRHEFTMEIVFRAADRAMADIRPDNIDKLVEKLHTLAKFVLKTIDLVVKLAHQLEAISFDLDISGLEYIIADKLSALAKDDKPLLICTCTRWMNSEEFIRPWIIKYGGMWGRIMHKSWQKAYHDYRAQTIAKLAETLDTTS